MQGGKGRGGGMGCGGGRGSGRGKGQGSERGSGRGGGQGADGTRDMGLGDVSQNIGRIFFGEDTMRIQPVGEPVKVVDVVDMPGAGRTTDAPVRNGEENLSLRAEINMLKDDIKIIYKILRKIQGKLDSLASAKDVPEEEKQGKG